MSLKHSLCVIIKINDKLLSVRKYFVINQPIRQCIRYFLYGLKASFCYFTLAKLKECRRLLQEVVLSYQLNSCTYVYELSCYIALNKIYKF